MITTKTLVAGLIGGAAAFAMGFLFFGILLHDFFAGESIVNTARGQDEMIWWAMILGHIAWGLLIAFIFDHWANISTVKSGIKGGVIIGLLVGMTYGFVGYGAENTMSLNGELVNILMMAVITGVIGAVVGLVLGYYKKDS